MRILITGGAGFIGSAVVRKAVSLGHEVVNLDALTYAANLENVAEVEASPLYAFERVDVCDAAAVRRVFTRHRPDVVMHLAAESHNDRSIESPMDFVQANLVGTAVLLEAARAHAERLPKGQAFRFHHISTDEVFGSLGETGAFDETTPYDPSSPYSASKAGADHLVRAWGRTFGLDVVVSNCANNYGPFQFPEKLIPTVISRALEGRPIEVYGDGRQVRSWLHVEDHAEALLTILAKGRAGETYCVGGDDSFRNLELVTRICAILDEVAPANTPHAGKIALVADRPGHDYRYAIDDAKLRSELGWAPRIGLAEGLESTVRWYVEHRDWMQRIRDRGFRSDRLGLLRA
jgi:dTDP-glucose 4,6-dehydratase